MSGERLAWLVIHEPGAAERTLPLARLPLTLGRDASSGLMLHDQFVSGRHAEIVQHDGGHAIRDLGSSNGTQLLGRPLTPGTLYPLYDGATLEIGDAHLAYRCEPAAPHSGTRPGKHRGNGVGVTPAMVPGASGGRDQTLMLGYAPAAPGKPVSPARSPVASPAPSPAHARPAGPARPSWVQRGLWRATRLVLWLTLWAAVGLVVLAGAAWVLAPPRVALLVLGSDARPDEIRHGAVGRTDTLLTVVADRSPGGLVLISIPRDLWVDIPNYGSERINAAYSLGGMRAAERAAANVLGVPVDRALLIGLQGVRDVVDAAGGIEIDVPYAIHDDAYPTDDYGTMVLDIPAGRQHMDGETALRYARTRHQDNDFGRMARQQQVMVALRSAMLRPVNWWRAPAVLAAVQQAAQTNLGPLDLATLAFAVAGSGGEPERLALDLGLVEEFQGANGAYLLRPTPALKQRVAALVTPASAAVEVLNGSGTDGLATQTAEKLRERKMRVVRLGNATRSLPETVIEVRPGYTRTGIYAAALLDLPRTAVHESAALPDDVDVRITLGGTRG
jgi:LCP family protein required for cell wall assembly